MLYVAGAACSQHYGRRFPTYNERNRRWVDKAVSAKWIIIRRARLFDGTPGPNGEKQHKLVGWMQIAGMGTYHRHYHRETWEERRTRKDKDGNEEEYWTTCTDGFDRSDTCACRRRACPAFASCPHLVACRSTSQRPLAIHPCVSPAQGREGLPVQDEVLHVTNPPALPTFPAHPHPPPTPQYQHASKHNERCTRAPSP